MDATSEENPCTEWWKNMINDVMSKMWGIFDETGIFLVLCRHGFVLVVADMIKSGELAKYPLAVLKVILDTFGKNNVAGYDVGCHFSATIRDSELGEQAHSCCLHCLVGSFHGHAHNHLCQLHFLSSYIEGMGLEDLETCERYFSRSNALAKSCRYASRFHRQQEISTYMKQFDTVETYANLSKFLPRFTGLWRRRGVVSEDEFQTWLAEEKAYLLELKKSSKAKVEETLEMEYVQKLINLDASRAKHSVVAAEARRAARDEEAYVPGVCKPEIARHHARQKMEQDEDVVRELEEKLGIVDRWNSTSPRWADTVAEVKKRKYQKALDALELRIVERIFELTKMNRSETGYKMRKHIAKALQARSKAVRNAIEKFNAAAIVLSPPMRTLSWEDIVDYAFLADFDILRDTSQLVQSRPWARPSCRLAMDKYFRICRAKEEIHRLNIEIPRHVTWIHDEDSFLRSKEQEFLEADPEMAVQIRRYRMERGRFDDVHMRRYWGLAKTPGFTGSIMPGVSREKASARHERQERRRREREGCGESAEMEEMGVEGEQEVEVVEVAPAMRWQRPPQLDDPEWVDVDDDEDEGEIATEAGLSNMVYELSMLAIDGQTLKDT
ncbi:hypothetical protein C8J57DRAFT_1522233 [Mycena rebaudengoi]|nr:hypothetical protein C8J57DRAFT_1522233 [Mycena rebaudengoi]